MIRFLGCGDVCDFVDLSSNTIFRHSPVIPESLYFGVSPSAEVAGNVFVRSLVASSGIHELTRWRKVKKFRFGVQPQLVLSDDLLGAAERAVKLSCLFGEDRDYLLSRGIGDGLIGRFGVVSTSSLVSLLGDSGVENLCLNIPAKFGGFVGRRDIVRGVSVPYYFDNVFCGFVTRVLDGNCDFVKYAFSLQNRCCWGVDFGCDEVWVVEGVFDAMKLIEGGFNALGLGDSQPNYFKLLMVSRFRRVNLMFDSDYAGLLGATKAFLVLSKLFGHKDVRICLLDSKDPCGGLSFTEVKFDSLVDRLGVVGAKIGNESVLPRVKNAN